ncbi:MAG: DNA binding domain, excisionase family [bacterium P201]|nr:MAG: DNA binding domain, excisionase family [bacterium P201]
MMPGKLPLLKMYRTKKHLLNDILDVKIKLKTHMEQNESNLSFDQLPKAVGELLTKVDYVISRLDEKKEVDGSSPTQDDDQMMTMDEACQFIGKKRSTMYSLTSERRIPYRKRGNKLYFFKKELVDWIQSGGAYDKPYTLSEQEQAEFDAHLEQMREKKRHKPAAVQQQ